MTTRVIACLLLTGLPGLLMAQDMPEVIKLSVRANSAPAPALRYSLLPDGRDSKPGNGALDYYRGFSPELWGNIQQQPVKYWDDLAKYANAPLDQLNAQLLINYPLRGSMMKMVDRGARREVCDWELAPRIAEEGVMTLLPDVQGMRNYANFLALRARLELAEGKIDAALYTFQTGLQMARHVAESHTLINNLVGAAITMIMVKQLEEFVQHPQAPNLYWALAQLPRPYFDLRKALSGERMMFEREFAPAADLEREPVSDEAAERVLDAMVERLSFGQRAVDKEALAAEIAAILPAARQALIRAGRAPAEVEKMPAIQAVLLFTRAESERVRDEIMKWLNLPYLESRDGLRRAREMQTAVKGKLKVISMFFDFHGSAEKVLLARLRVDRKFASLRAVEAIKLHVADNGSFPKTLDEVKAAPMPMDPFNGKPFEYKLDGDRAILTVPLYGMVRGSGWQYEITIRK